MHFPPWLRSLLLGAFLLPMVAVLADEPTPDPKRIERQVRLLLADLKNADSDAVRVTAIRDLGRLGPAAKRAVPTLVGLLKDRAPQVRLETAFGLLKIDQGKGKEAIDTLTALLEDKAAASYHLFVVVYMKDVRPASKETVTALLALVRHKHPLAPIAGCLALDNLGPQTKDAAGVLEKALQDDNVLVRTRAALGLTRIDPRNADKAVPVLREALQDKDFDVRHHAALALLEIDRKQLPAVVEALALGLKDPSLDMRLRTAEFLLEQDPAQAKATVPVVAAALRDKDQKTRLRAIILLAGLGDTGAAAEKELRTCFKDADARVAAAAVEALMRMQPEKAAVLFPVLVEQRDRKKQTGLTDILKLLDELDKLAARAGDSELLKSLTEQLRKKFDKPYTDVLRVDAAVRLAALGPKAKQAVGDLIKALGDPSLLVRSQALYALGQIGPEARDAADRLKELYKDRQVSADLRQTAGRALKKISPEAAKDLGID